MPSTSPPRGERLRTLTPRQAELLLAKIAVRWGAPRAYLDFEHLDALHWAERYATIVTPEGRTPFKPYAYQAEILNDDAPRRLILKARQTGISYTMACESVYWAIKQPNTTTLFVSRNQNAASELVRYCMHIIVGLQLPEAEPSRQNNSELGWANGSRIVSLPSTPGTGRGIAAQRVVLDEFGWCADDQFVFEAIVPTLAPGAPLTVLSTPNGRANLFFRLWEGLEGGAWSRHQVHWQDCDRYSLEWATEMKATMTAEAWAQEYDLDFRTSGGTVFTLEDVERCKDGYTDIIVPGWRTITGWDIGRRSDWSVGITLQEDPHGIWHLVAFQRVRAPYPDLQALINERCRTFRKNAAHYVESNGIGDPVIENLEERVTPFTTTARTKLQGLDAIQLLLQNGRLKLDEPEVLRELQLYQREDSSLMTDCVAALWVACSQIERPPAPKVGFY